MKIAISGKGGSGKTTLSATLARVFAQRGQDVLAIDGDPNPNLGVALGMTPPELAKLEPLPRDVVKERVEESGEKRVVLARPLEEITAQYGVGAPAGVTLLLGCRVDHAGAG